MPGRGAGFTLLELMVVLAIVGLLALAVAPDMRDWMRNQNIRNTAQSLQNGLQIARHEAMRRNQPVGFWLVAAGNTQGAMDDDCQLSASSGSWVVSVSDPAGQCASEPSATEAPMVVDKEVAGAASVSVAAVNAGGSAASSLRFDGYGRIASSSVASAIARIDIRDSSDASNSGDATDTFRRLRLLISGTGAIHLCDPALSSTGTDPRRCPS
ncbi:type II secretion system protein GspH [Corticibacter populi]|uniref:Type II secretion system protein H n=2 Tax=Corticibacter populi TaxID=1550736 RepID=A0A3M6QJ30_9BURK|nr:type II secretion system protein GspH [Corticibacter populi]